MADTQTEPVKERREPVKLDLPMMSIQLHRPEMPKLSMPSISMPHIPLPHVSKQEVGQAVDVAKSILPPPERVAYYGALGALAVFGVVEWPVAAAIGVGTVIAQRARRNGNGDKAGSREAGQPKPAPKEPAGKRETAGKAAESATAKRKEAETVTAKRKAATVRDTLQRRKNAAGKAGQ